eukprot:7690881-Pyramimonas_sp.AAC.1
MAPLQASEVDRRASSNTATNASSPSSSPSPAHSTYRHPLTRPSFPCAARCEEFAPRGLFAP